MVKVTKEKTQGKLAWMWQYGARLVLATLAVAGAVHLLAPVDKVLAYGMSVIIVALLLREI